MSDYPPNNNTNEDFGNLIKEIKNTLETHLKELLSSMFIDADEEIFGLANSAVSNKDQNRYFELMRILRESKQDISINFLSKTNLLLRPFSETEISRKKSTIENTDELSLVGQDEMEEMVLIKSISGNVAGKCREAISHLEARLEHLALKTPHIFSKKSLDPINICQAFDDALEDRFELKNKKLLFQLFEKNVAARLGPIYDAINNLFIEAGVLPQIKLHAKQSSSKQRPVPPPEDHIGDDDEGDEHNQPINQGGYAMTATPGHNNQGGRYSRSGGGSSNASTTRGGMNQQGSTQGTSSGAGGSNAGAGYSGGDAGGSAGGSAGTGYSGGASTSADSMNQQGGTQGTSSGAGGSNAGAGYSGGAGDSTGTGYSGGASTSTDSMSQQGGTQGASSGAGGSGGAGHSSASSNNGATGGSPAEGGNGSSNEMTASGTSHSGNYQHNTAGMPASRVSDVIGEYMGTPIAPPPLNDGETSESYPVTNQQYYGHDAVLSALSSIQIQPEFSSSGELKFDAEAIKQAVLAEIARTSGGVVTKRLNRIAEKTIDFIELIFDAIIEDENISDTIKALLLRLQIPVIKASMVDQEFFIYDTHPARVLLDRIAEVGIGVSDHTDEVYIQLDKTISKLVSEFELQTSSFQEALDAINEFIKGREELARKEEEETQRQVLRQHARNTVLQSLRKITTGKSLPESCHALVLKRWPTLMYNHYLNHGKENDEWISIIETLRDIIHSVQPLKTKEDLNNLISTKDRLIETTLKYLNRTNQSKKDIEEVIQGLINIHQHHIDNADFSKEVIRSAQESEVEAATEEQQPEQMTPVPLEPATRQEKPSRSILPANIMPGMWFQIYIGEDRALRRGKLSVIIIDDSKLVFVNYQGGIIVEKSIEEFAKELEEGKSKVIMGHSAFDHALSRVVTNLNTKH